VNEQAEQIDEPVEVQDTFEKELRNLINRHSRENVSNTPDWCLAEYLMACLEAFDVATNKRTGWHSVGPVEDVVDIGGVIGPE
jgi:hypothetical protein